MANSHQEDELPYCASTGIMSSPGFVNASDQELRRAISSIDVSRLFITGSCA
ncbi:MAG: hypothetical protein Q7W05_03125 [Deltaproteobacteria bacterium]|nr:hypothetical protein [Deltaproteobacteria bacterium]